MDRELPRIELPARAAEESSKKMRRVAGLCLILMFLLFLFYFYSCGPLLG
jgi:hypothetical protein